MSIERPEWVQAESYIGTTAAETGGCYVSLTLSTERAI